MLQPQDCSLTVVDVQGKLAQLMHDRDSLFTSIRIIIQSARILDVPVLWCQQVPDALGPTVPQIAELLADCEPVDKSSFSCCGCETYTSALGQLNRRHAVLCGIETHVCVYQTAVELMQHDYEVTVLADAVSSRTAANKQAGLDRMAAEGVSLRSVEMICFEWLKTAEHPKFRQIARLVK